MTSPSANRVALVAGASGVAGSALVEQLADSGWRVVALQRNPQAAPSGPNVTRLAADLYDPEQLARELHDTPVTHLFYAAHAREAMKPAPKPLDPVAVRRQLHIASRTLLPVLRRFPALQAPVYERFGDEAGSTDRHGRNLAMLRNVLSVLEQGPHRLEHVALVTGLKYHGMHLGPAMYPDWKLPITEESQRPRGPNWYYDVESHLAARATRYTWSVARPSFIVGHARGAPYNLGTGLAVYASLLKALGRPLIFPGGSERYREQIEMSSGAGLARFLIWSATTDAARNQAFSYVNGDVTCWADLWPIFGRFFEMPIEIPKDPIGVERMLAGEAQTWSDLVRQHRLQPTTLEEVCPLRFLDQGIGIGWEIAVSMDKARRAGFSEVVPTHEMFLSLFRRLREERIIP